MFTLSTNTSFITAVLVAAITHSHKCLSTVQHKVRMTPDCPDTPDPAGARAGTADMGTATSCCPPAPHLAFGTGESPTNQPLMCPCWGKGLRDLILPQAFAVSSRSKKELDAQLPCGFCNKQRGHSCAVVCIIYDYLSLKKQIDWAIFGDGRLKPRHS